MAEGVRALCAVALPDGIYVLGGYNGKEYLNTVQKYFHILNFTDLILQQGNGSPSAL